MKKIEVYEPFRELYQLNWNFIGNPVSELVREDVIIGDARKTVNVQYFEYAVLEEHDTVVVRQLGLQAWLNKIRHGEIVTKNLSPFIPSP